VFSESEDALSGKLTVDSSSYGGSTMKWRVVAALTVFCARLLAAQAAPDWAKQSPKTSPSPRFVHAQAYDPVHGQVILFGGSNNTVVFGDTWAWDGSNWTQEALQTGPPARYSHTMAYDSAHGQVVLFGGFGASGKLLNDTWVWDGANWTQEFRKRLRPLDTATRWLTIRHTVKLSYSGARIHPMRL
jgi:hypothetical protein